MDKRNHILEAAEDLFSQKGFEGTSIRDLSKKAGINIAMVSYYFGSKEKLFESLVEYRAGFMLEKLQGIEKEKNLDPMHKVEQMIDLYVDRITSNNKFSRILHRELSLQQRTQLHESIADILVKNLIEIRKIINDGIKKKVFKQVDSEMIISTILGTLWQATSSKELVTRIIGCDPKSFTMSDTSHKNRIKKYLKELMRSYLLIKKSH